MQKLDCKTTFGKMLKFALPSIIMMVVMSIYNIVDGIFVSNLIGNDALASVNIVFPLASIVIAIGAMFGSGITAIVSKQLGEGNKKEASQNATAVIIIAVICGVVLTTVCVSLTQPIVRLLGASDKLVDYASSYALPLACFFPVTILQLIFQNLLIVCGKQTYGLVATFAGGVINVILDYVLIQFTGLGIAGAAIATGIGSCFTPIVGIVCFCSKKNLIRFAPPKFRFKIIGNTLTNGSSEMVGNLAQCIVTILYNLVMMRLLGEDGVAAIAVILYLDFIMIAVNLGYSMGVAPLIGYNYGKDERGKLKQIVRNSLLFCMGFGIAATAFAAGMSPLLVQIFTSKNSPVYSIAASGMVIYAFSYLFKGFNIYGSAMFTAFSNGKISALIAAARTLVFLSATIPLFAFLFGSYGVWFASPVAEVLALGVTVPCLILYAKKYHYGRKSAAPQMSVSPQNEVLSPISDLIVTEGDSYEQDEHEAKITNDNNNRN